mmetsp:Transcript_5351/g.6642  ORF Transcript_5351/g.6642 Transcript_5351/m.6642 type:complete len:93 (-) Transcript_5351:505-783(-)
MNVSSSIDIPKFKNCSCVILGQSFLKISHSSKDLVRDAHQLITSERKSACRPHIYVTSLFWLLRFCPAVFFWTECSFGLKPQQNKKYCFLSG